MRVRPTGSGRHLREGTRPVVNGARRRILSSRSTPKGFLLDLAGLGDRFEAADLRGAELVLDRAELDEPAEDEFYVADLVGLPATDEAGEALGTVVEVFETPAHEVLVVRPEGGASERYVPFTLVHVPEVNPGSGRLVVRPPEE